MESYCASPSGWVRLALLAASLALCLSLTLSPDMQVKVRGCNAFQYCHVPCTTAAPGEIIVFSIGFHSGCYASWAWMRVVVAAARGRLGLQNLQGGVKAAA